MTPDAPPPSPQDDPARAARALDALGRDVQVLYVDNHLLAVAKPAGLLTQAAEAGDDNLLDRARAYLKVVGDKPGNVYVGLVHRLDRNVSGVVLLARTSKAAARLTQAFAGRDVDKLYLGVVEGVTAPEGRLAHRLGPSEDGRGVVARPDGKEARLSWRRLAVRDGRSLLAIQLETGRKHQIRAQLALAGHPLVGDPRYGRPSREARGRGAAGAMGRPALHAWRLTVPHPIQREPLAVEAPLPADLERLLRGWVFDLGRATG